MATSTGTVRFEIDSLTGMHWVAVLLAAVTGMVHLYLFASQGWVPFLLAGLGFYGAIALILVLPAYRPWLYLAGIPFTLAQMVGWYVVEQPAGIGDVSGLAAFDKIVQILLIVLLVMLYRSR